MKKTLYFLVVCLMSLLCAFSVVACSVSGNSGNGNKDKTENTNNQEEENTNNNYKSIIGKFKIINFNCQQNDQLNRGRELCLNGNYRLNDLATDIVNFDFEVTKELKLNCTYSDTVKQKLGEDENAVLSAINSCVFDKYSNFVTTATFKLSGVDFTIYLTKTENGFNSTMDYVIDNIRVNISFDIVYVK